MELGIVGSGNIDSLLARRFAALKHRVFIAKQLVLGLIDALGFDGLDAGTLADSWRQQPGTPAYCRDLGKADLVAALAQADADKVAQYRAEADEVARPYFAAPSS